MVFLALPAHRWRDSPWRTDGNAGNRSGRPDTASRRHPAAHLPLRPAGLRAASTPTAFPRRRAADAVAVDRLAARASTEARRRSLTVAGAAQVVDAACAAALLFPVSPAWLQYCTAFRHRTRAGVYQPNVALAAGCGAGDTIKFMLDELNSLGTKLAELAGRVRALREENHALRQQLATTKAELAETRGRVDSATRRIDALVERLAADAGASRN